MFYDRYLYLCKQKGVTPSSAAIDAGISKSLVSKWKKAPSIIPSPEVLQKLSDYFGVPISELLDEQKSSPSQPELTEGELMLLELFRRIPEDRQGAAIELLRAALKMQ